MSLQSQIESILFVAIKPMPIKELADLLKVKTKEAEEALETLGVEYKNNGRGLSLIKNNNQYQLTTAPENAALIQEFLKMKRVGNYPNQA